MVHLALFEMAHLQGLTSDPKALSEALVPRVGAGAVEEAIELNERKGLVTRGGGTLRAAEDHVFSLPEDETEAAALRRGMRHLHQWYLHRAGEALNEFPSKERFFHADLLMVPASGVAALHKRVGQFHAEMLLLAESMRREASPTEEHQLQFLGMQVYPLSEKVRGTMAKKYKLLGPEGHYESETPGTLGGNGRAKIYGRLDCSSANRAVRSGPTYATHRVFFADEKTAIASGYRPCGNCMREKYNEWKAGQE